MLTLCTLTLSTSEVNACPDVTNINALLWHYSIRRGQHHVGVPQGVKLKLKALEENYGLYFLALKQRLFLPYNWHLFAS